MYILVVVLFIANESCKKDKPDPYVYSVPELADEGWGIASAEDAGLSTDVLSEMMNLVGRSDGHNIHNILIFVDSLLVFEEYFEGYLYSSDPPGSNGDYIQYDRETDHFLASVSKTVTSAVFGVAVRMGIYY